MRPAEKTLSLEGLVRKWTIRAGVRAGRFVVPFLTKERSPAPRVFYQGKQYGLKRASASWWGGSHDY